MLHLYPFSFLFDNGVFINTNSPRKNSVFTTMGACFLILKKKQHMNALYKWSRTSSTPDLYKKNEWVDDEKQLYMYDKYHWILCLFNDRLHTFWI